MSRISLSLCRAIVAAAVTLAACGAAAQTEAPELSESTLYELLLGEIALQRGDAALAANTYLEVAKSTRDPRVARRAIEIANFARMPEVALEAAKTWHDIEPASPQALQVLAAMLIGAKRVEEAQPYLEKLLASDGVNIENGFTQLNRLLAGNPDKVANLRVVRSLAARYPALAQAHYAVAQAAFAAGDEAAALASVRQAAALRPEWEAAAIFEAQVLQKRSPSEAAARLGAFVAQNPNSRDARLNYARVLVLDKRLPEARQQFEALLAANPGNADVIYAVGVLAFQLKDYPLAEEQKQWGRAIEWYEQVGGDEQALAARMRTAGALAKQGKLDEARALLRRVGAEHPEQGAQLIVAEAQLLRDANRPRDAFDMLRQALQKDSEQPDLLYDFALTAEKLERFDILEANLRKLIAVRPDHAHAYNALGYSFAERNLRLPEAKKLIERALELAPEDYFIIDSLGWVLYREGDLKGAAEQLRRAYLGRPDAEIGAHLGEVLWMLGERDDARRIWQEALKSSPENDTLLKTLQRFGK